MFSYRYILFLNIISLITSIPFPLHVSWFPRNFSINNSFYRPGEYELTYPLVPAGPLHSLSSQRTGTIYTLGTIAINGTNALYAPITEIMNEKYIPIKNTLTLNSNTLYSSFYISKDIGLSWESLPTVLPHRILRWLSTAVLFEIGPRSNMINDTLSTIKPSCTLICVLGGVYEVTGTNNITKPTSLLPTNRVDCSNDEGLTWFTGPSLPFAVKQASVIQYGYQSILLAGGNRYSISDSTTNETFIPSNTTCNCGESLRKTTTNNTSELSINIWEARVRFISSNITNTNQCILDMEYGWVPWNQSTPASHRTDILFSSYYKSNADAIQSEEFLNNVNSNNSYITTNNYNYSLPILFLGAGNIPHEYRSIPVYDLWYNPVSSDKFKENNEIAWILANSQISTSSSANDEFLTSIINEPTLYLTDLRNGNSEAILPGDKNSPDTVNFVNVDQVTFYMENNYGAVSLDNGRSFLPVLHRQYPSNTTDVSADLTATTRRSLRRISMVRDPVHNFEPVLIGWTFVNGQMWRGDFKACKSCPPKYWTMGCVNDPYDAVCKPCSTCEPGYFQSIPCMTLDFPMDTLCTKCSECRETEVMVVPCSSVSDTRCVPKRRPGELDPVYILNPNTIIIDKDIIPIYVTGTTVFLFSLLVGLSIHSYNRFQQFEKYSTLFFLKEFLMQILPRFLVFNWSYYGTILSLINHSILFILIDNITLLSNLFILLLVIFCLGICYNVVSFYYFVTRIPSFIKDDSSWVEKVRTILIGILAIFHTRLFLCHFSLAQASISSSILNLSHSNNDNYNVPDQKCGSTSLLASANSVSSTDEKISPPSGTQITKEWRTTSVNSRDNVSPTFSSTYRYLLFIIIGSTILMDIPFIFPVLYSSAFTIPTHFMVFLILSTILDLFNIIVTLIAFGKRLDRLNLITKLLAKQQTISLVPLCADDELDGHRNNNNNDYFLRDENSESVKDKSRSNGPIRNKKNANNNNTSNGGQVNNGLHSNLSPISYNPLSLNNNTGVMNTVESRISSNLAIISSYNFATNVPVLPISISTPNPPSTFFLAQSSDSSVQHHLTNLPTVPRLVAKSSGEETSSNNEHSTDSSAISESTVSLGSLFPITSSPSNINSTAPIEEERNIESRIQRCLALASNARIPPQHTTSVTVIDETVDDPPLSI